MHFGARRNAEIARFFFPHGENSIRTAYFDRISERHVRLARSEGIRPRSSPRWGVFSADGVSSRATSLENEIQKPDTGSP